METLRIAVLLGIYALSIFIALYWGYKQGKRDERARSLKAVAKTMNSWMDAQYEAGVTEEMVEKINACLAKDIVKELKSIE